MSYDLKGAIESLADEIRDGGLDYWLATVRADGSAGASLLDTELAELQSAREAVEQKLELLLSEIGLTLNDLV